MNNPLISVIVPIYNVEKYLDQCVSSIVSQTYKNIEIILVDDGSPDNCPKMCDDWAKKDERIKVIHKQNGGLVSARKAGLLSSTGEYVTAVDSDDYIDETLLEKAVSIITSNDSPDVVSFNYTRVFPDHEDLVKNIFDGLYVGGDLDMVKNSLFYDKTLPGTKSGVIFGICSKFFKREIVIDKQLSVPENITRGEDIAVTAPTIIDCNSLYFCSFAGYYYRANPTSIINSYDKKEFDRLHVLFNYLNGIIDDKYLNQVLVCLLNMYILAMKHTCLNSKKRKQAITEIRASMPKSTIHSLKTAKIYKCSLSYKIIVFLVKRRLYSILYYVFKFANREH